jgi:hypothetical protein
LEDDEDVATETPVDSPRLEWWEEAERKAEEEEEEEEEEEMLEEQEVLLESFATARKEERTREATAQAVRAESSPCRHGRVPACLQFPKDSPRLRAFGRPLRRGARHLMVMHHAP